MRHTGEANDAIEVEMRAGPTRAGLDCETGPSEPRRNLHTPS